MVGCPVPLLLTPPQAQAMLATLPTHPALSQDETLVPMKLVNLVHLENRGEWKNSVTKAPP